MTSQVPGNEESTPASVTEPAVHVMVSCLHLLYALVYNNRRASISAANHAMPSLLQLTTECPFGVASWATDVTTRLSALVLQQLFVGNRSLLVEVPEVHVKALCCSATLHSSLQHSRSHSHGVRLCVVSPWS